MKVIIKKVRIITKDGRRQFIRMNKARRKTNDLEGIRKQIKAYTNAKYVHLEFMEVK